MLFVALVLAVWSFVLGDLTPSQRFILLWLLPLASAFFARAFAGQMKIEGTLKTIGVTATGGFAVWVLSYFLLPGARHQEPEFPTREQQVRLEEKMPQSLPPKLSLQESERVSPATPAEEVSLRVYNQSDRNLYVFLYNCEEQLDTIVSRFVCKPVRHGQHIVFEKFRHKSFGWYMIYVGTPEGRIYELGRRFIFTNKHPSLTIVSSAKGFELCDP